MLGPNLQRPLADYLRLFETAGFVVEQAEIVRYGHFPALVPIRYGLVPGRWFPVIRRLERWLARTWGEPFFDYADVRFELSRAT
jgi:hypothetical protein